MKEEYKKLMPVAIYDGLFEVREGYGCYIVERKHEWAKRKYKRYPLMDVDKIVDEEFKYHNKCKYSL